MLYLIGLGLGKKSVTVEGFEIIKKCKKVYLENYTSVIEPTLEELESFFGRKLVVVERDFVENKIESIFENARKEDIAFLIKGDNYSASTHFDIYLRAKKEKVPIKVISGISILTAVGITGLFLYNFGKIVSIPFHNENIKSPIEYFLMNKKNNLHTLFLLDLNPIENKFLTIKEACDYLIKNKIPKNTLALGCARLGFSNQKIKTSTLEKLGNENFGKPPYCLIIPGKLHFKEEEALELWN